MGSGADGHFDRFQIETATPAQASEYHFQQRAYLPRRLEPDRVGSARPWVFDPRDGPTRPVYAEARATSFSSLAALVEQASAGFSLLEVRHVYDFRGRLGTKAKNRRGLSTVIRCSTSSLMPAAFSFGRNTVSVFE